MTRGDKAVQILLNEPATVSEVADRLGLSRTGVYHALTRHGVPRSSRYLPARITNHLEEVGVPLSSRELADALEADLDSVRRSVARMRERGELRVSHVGLSPSGNRENKWWIDEL